MLRQSIFEYRHHQLQTQHYQHIDHCIEVLRDDVLCNADDTPRVTSGNASQLGSGIGQARLCRDWKKLDEWVDKHTACFEDDGTRVADQIEKYKHCPDSSKPWETMGN